MAHPDHGWPAFPSPTVSQNQATGETIAHQAYGGMTLRDYFAAKAMSVLLPGLIGELDRLPDRTAAEQTRRGCKAAYMIADAMLQERQS